VKRPILWVALAFALGVAIASTYTGGWIFISPIIAAIGIIAALLGRYDRRFFLVGVVALFCAAGMFRWDLGRPGVGDPISRWVESEGPGFATVHGRVRESELFARGDDYLQFVMDATSVEHRGQRRDMGGRLLVRWNAANRPLFVGDTVTIRGEPSVVLSPVNWDVHSYEDSLRRRGIHTTVRCRGGVALSKTAAGSRLLPFNASGRFRYALSERLSDAVPEFARAFVLAVWLGDRSHMTQDERDSFVRSGTAHILAVSGVHTSIVFVTASFILARFIRIARYRAIFIMVAVGIFALTAGARVATVRAAMMIAVYVAADVFDRERDAPTALGIAGFVFLLWDPALLFDGGAQLSFASIASILIFGERIGQYFPFSYEPLGQALSTTLSVHLLPMPIAATMFHLIPRYAFLANLFVVPMLGIVLWLCLLTSVIAFISPPLALIFGHATAGVVFAIQKIAEFTAALPFSTMSMTKPTAIAAIFYWAALGVAIARTKYRRLFRVIGVATLLAMSYLLWRPIGLPAQIRILDVSHGDAAIIRSAAGSVALIDGGDQSEYVDMGARVVIPSLSAMGASHVDYVFVSHSDRDHLGGLMATLDRMSVGRVIMGPADPENEVEQEFLEVCARRNVPVTRASQGDRFQLDDGAFTVLHPPKEWPGKHSRNDLSLVLRYDWQGPSMLFAGDIEEAGERALSRQNIRAAILKAPHHGSDSSSTPGFIEAVSPDIVLVSAGDSRKRISNPQAVIDRYRQAGVDIWRTSESGGLLIEADPSGVQIEGARPARGYPGSSTGDP